MSTIGAAVGDGVGLVLGDGGGLRGMMVAVALAGAVRGAECSSPGVAMMMTATEAAMDAMTRLRFIASPSTKKSPSP
jgi:hypothetical protein